MRVHPPLFDILPVLRRVVTIVLIVLMATLGVQVPVQANSALLNELPQPGHLLSLSQYHEPPLIRGMRFFANNPLRFDFIIDVGQNNLDGEELTLETQRMVKYFLAALTVPEDEMWVNLSPFENDRIVPAGFGITLMGRDMLAQDYILKQITASLMYPEEGVGKDFWERVYTKAHQLYGKTDIPISTFNKVWIVPDKVVVYEHEDTAYVLRSRLKVMLEEDYVAMKASHRPEELDSEISAADMKQAPEVTQIIREVMIPEIEREVNEGEHFRPLRQIYHSMILATWFKRNLKQSFLGRKYVDQKKISGVDVSDKDIKYKIYQRYLDAFQSGAYNYIKEEYDPVTQELIPRKYFSGGTSLALTDETFEVVQTLTASDRAVLSRNQDRLRIAPTNLELRATSDAAILSEQSYAQLLVERFLDAGLSTEDQLEQIDEYLRNYSFVANHSRAVVEDTSPNVLSLFDEFELYLKSEQSNILSIARILIERGIDPRVARQQAQEALRLNMDRSVDELDVASLFELLSDYYRLNNANVLLLNSGAEMQATEGLLRGQVGAVVRADPQYVGVSTDGYKLTTIGVEATELSSVVGSNASDALIINRRFGDIGQEVTDEQIGEVIQQAGIALRKSGQLIVVADPLQAESVAEAIRLNSFENLSIITGEQGVLLTATQSSGRDAAILVTDFYNQPSIENYRSLSSEQREQIKRQAMKTIGSVENVGRGQQYAVEDFIYATLENALRTRVNVIERYGPDALYISLGSSPEWMYRALEMVNPDFDRFRFVAFSLQASTPITDEQAEAYFDYLNEVIGEDVRNSSAPIIISDFVGGGRTFARFTEMLERWAQREGVDDIAGRLVVHSIEDVDSNDRVPPELMEYGYIHQTEIRNEFIDASMNSEFYFRARWTPRFLPTRWDADNSPFADGINIRPSRRAAYMAFLIADTIFGEQSPVRPESLSIRGNAIVSDRTVNLTPFAERLLRYTSVEEMRSNLTDNIEDVITEVARTLPATEYTELARSFPFALELLSTIGDLYGQLSSTDSQGRAVGLVDENYHNHFHNLLVTMGNIIWNASSGTIESAQDLKVALVSGLLHDFHVRRVLGEADTTGKQWVTTAFVPETLAQIRDLFGLQDYDQPLIGNADYTNQVSDAFKQDFRRILDGLLGDGQTRADFYAEIEAGIRRTDFASDRALPEVTYQELAAYNRYVLDAEIEKWLSGEIDFNEAKANVDERWEAIFTKVAEDYQEERYGSENREIVRETAVRFLIRRQNIDIGFLESLANIPDNRRFKVFELANRLELADQSGSFWLTSTPVGQAVIEGLAQELPFISEAGTYTYFIAQVVATLRNISYIQELPTAFQENFIRRVDELVAASDNTLVPRRNATAKAFWAREREMTIQLLGLDEVSLTGSTRTDRAVLGDGRRMPQNPREFQVNDAFRAQLIERYGEGVVTDLEEQGQLDNFYSLNENLKIVVADLDRRYAQSERKEDEPTLFIRGGIIRRFESRDLSDLLPNTDLDIIIRDNDNYTVRDVQDRWFDNNRVQVMAMPFTPRSEFVEVDREQLQGSPFYILDIWVSRAPDSESDSTGQTDRAVLSDSSENVGGIDLNPAMLDIESQGQGVQLNTPVDMGELEAMPIGGITPVIFQIVPVTNLPLLLGINDLDDSDEQSFDSIQLSANQNPLFSRAE